MQQRALTELFERFRTSGDVQALGEAFERTAADLLRVARRVSGDRHDAEDLVQATYLTAVEKARTLTPDRDPMPWLVGILTLHARNLRRKRGRSVEAWRLDKPAVTPPDVEVERAELDARVREALAEMPERYAAVLAPYLDGSYNSASIAQATGDAPGTVRMQLHRGLELLRRSLGRALPLGAWFDARQLARLERRVIEAASRGRGLPPPFATSSLLPLLAATLVAIVGLGAGWAAYSGFEPARKFAAFPSLSSASDPSPATSSTTLAADGVRLAVAALSETSQSATQAAPRERGVRGRLLHHDGSPAEGVEIRLAGIPTELRWIHDPSNAPVEFDLERSRCTTDADGTFVLPGARRGDLNLLAIDCGGAFGAVRQVDGAPDADGELDLGDVRLAATTALRGRVVDASGAAVPHARIRVAPAAPELAAAFSNSAFAAQFAGVWRASEAPEWIRNWIEIFPTPTTRSADDGSFVLHAPGESVKLIFDARNFATRESDVGALGVAVKELGDIVLAAGRTVRGRVVDAAGVPVVNAHVLVGARPDASQPSTGLVACDPTDAQGRFEQRGAPERGGLLLAARRSAGLAWSFVEAEGGQEIEIVLAPTASLRVSLRDEDGAPIDSAALDIVANPFPGSRSVATAQLTPIRRDASDGETLDGFCAGAYTLVARKAGYASARVDVTVHAPLTEVALVLSRANARTVVVRDAVTGESIEDAHVRLVNARRGESLAQGRSDADGRVELTLPKTFTNEGLQLQVRHASFAPCTAAAALERDEAQVVELLRGGALVAQVVERGLPTPTRKTLTLIGVERDGFPIQCSTDAEGIARIERLAPGAWKHQVSEAWSSGDALALWASRESQDAALRRGAFEIVDGEVTQLMIELDPSYASSTVGRARVHGRVRLPGANLQRLKLQLDAQKDERHGNEHFDVDVDAEGRFDAGWIPAGRVYAHLSRTRGSELEMMGGDAWSSLLTLAEGEIRELDIALQRTLVRVTVRDAAGAAAPGLAVSIEDAKQRRTSAFLAVTGADGTHEQLLYASGDYFAVAEDAALGYGRAPFTVSPTDETLDVELTLDRGVSLSGVVHAPAGFAASASDAERELFLTLRRGDDPSAPYRTLRLPTDADGRAPFEISGLTPGPHVLHLGGRVGVHCAPLQLEIGPSGASGLELEFVPARQ